MSNASVTPQISPSFMVRHLRLQNFCRMFSKVSCLQVAAVVLGMGAVTSSSAAADEMASRLNDPFYFPSTPSSRIAAAFQAYGGHVDIGGKDALNEGEDISFKLGGGSGSLLFYVTPNVTLQIDGSAEFSGADTLESTPQDNYEAGFNGAVHLSKRNTSRGLFGVFAAAFGTESLIGSDGGDKTALGLAIGAEAQVHYNRFTTYAQTGYFGTLARGNGNDDVDEDFPGESGFVRLVQRAYVSENTKLELDFVAAKGVFDVEDEDFHILSASGEVEQGFGHYIPFSLFARYEFIYADQADENDSTHDSTIKVGMKLRLGDANETLFAQNRVGNTLSTPDFARFGGILNGPIE